MGLPNCLVTSCRIFRCFRLSSHRPLISFSFSVVPRNGTEYVGVQCLFVARSITLGFYFYCHIRYIFFCDINLQTLQIYVVFFIVLPQSAMSDESLVSSLDGNKRFCNRNQSRCVTSRKSAHWLTSKLCSRTVKRR